MRPLLALVAFFGMVVVFGYIIASLYSGTFDMALWEDSTRQGLATVLTIIGVLTLLSGGSDD